MHLKEIMCCLNSSGTGLTSVAVHCEEGSETSGCVKSLTS
jgi:hypothetical protein